jgi:light-independent protochlorophyllide reductase subunit N
VSAVIPIQPIAAQACDESPVLRERGQREVFCGLTGIIWLHRKIQDAFFLVVGSRTCAHLIQSAAGVMIFAEPRFATAIIDERDLAGLADANAELDRVVTRLLERRPEIKPAVPGGLLPVRSHQAGPVACGLPAVGPFLAPRAGAELFRQRHRDHLHAGEDACLASLVPACRRTGRRAGCQLLVVGTLADVVEDQFTRLFQQLGIGPVQFFPPRRSTDLPAIGPQTRFLLAQPFLADTARLLESRGATRLAAPFPLGAEGTTCGCRPPPDAIRCGRRAFRAGDRAGQGPQCSAALARHRSQLAKASASSSFRIRSSRFRSPASWRANWACSWSRSARPTCTASIWPRNSRCCRGHAAQRRPACREAAGPLPCRRPDIVVCGLGLANPLEAEGMTTKWAIELVFTPIQGYEQAADLAELFARPLVRRLRLAV